MNYKKNSLEEKISETEWRESGYKYIFRIYEQKDFFGFCFLGPKKSKVPYTESELNLVKELVNEIPHIFSNLKMISELLEKDRSKQEVSWAKKMLDEISAAKDTKNFNDYDLQLYSSLSKEIQGDMIDVNDKNENGFIGLYDAFHHGIKAVLTLNLVFSIFRSAIPSERIKKLNEVLRSFSAFSLSTAVTLIIGENEKLTFINAGNPPPLFLADRDCKKIVESGKPLGIEKKELVETAIIDAPTGDEMIFVASKGLYKLFEASKAGKLLDFLKAKNTGCIKKLSSEIKSIISDEFSKTGFQDDITFFLLKRRAK
jgi:serine phosphatase RsbU (regulator of sigma subunit)